MAEKKFGLGAGMVIGSIAIGAACGVAYYFKREEIKRLAEDIISRVKPADGADVETGDWDIISGAAETDAEDVNIVDSGISLDSVEGAEEGAAEYEPAAETENEAEAQPESGTDDEAAPESEEDADGQPEESGDGQPKKKTWFWSK